MSLEKYTSQELEYMLERYPWFSMVRCELLLRGEGSTGGEPYLSSLPATRFMSPVEPLEVVPEDISLPFVQQDEELISETLAEIYLAQGLQSQAAEVYRKLSLKYPEKSSYFASRMPIN